MANYTINFHNSSGTIIDTHSLELWAGNRVNSDRTALSVAQTFYAALIYHDDDTRGALWMSFPTFQEAQSAERKLDELLAMPIEWKDGAVSMSYLMAGRVKAGVFTLNESLGKQLCPNTELFITHAEKGFQLAFEAARRAG